MTKTLILLFHPFFDRSKANRALARAAESVPDVELADMYKLYPAGAVDAEAETRRLLSADRLVLQFPVQWYSTPSLLKAWQDTVLTRMFYIAPEEGARLEGRPMMAAATAGNVPQAYRPEGANLFPLDELLAPLQATAHRCGMPWRKPFLVYDAGRLDADALAATGRRYAERLTRGFDISAPRPVVRDRWRGFVRRLTAVAR